MSFADQVYEAEHDLLPSQNRGLAPGFECLLSACDGGLHLAVCHLRDPRHEVIRCRIMEVDELVGGGVDELVVDEVWRVDRLQRLVSSREAGGSGVQRQG